MELDLKLASKEINQLLWNTDKTLSTAESCTAGRIATIITAAPGSSTYYRGGLCCYAEDVKSRLLGVSEELMERETPVCEEVARQMVVGANRLFGTDYAVAITGYAGPGGGPEAPVGTIFVAVGTADDIEVRELTGDDGREENVVRASLTALQMLLERLKRDFPTAEE